MPHRRQVEEVERRGADERGEQPERETPVGRDEQHRQQVDDTERHGRRDLPERVDDRRAEAHRREGDAEAHQPWRLIVPEQG